MNRYFVYIMTNKRNGTLYIGFSTDLPRRDWQHKNKVVEGFTKKYSLDKLVYFKEFGDLQSAKLYEKQLKEWKRQWKIELIEKDNPYWLNINAHY